MMDRDWTDKRMDDFKERVDQRFDEVDRRFDKVDARLDKVESKVDATNRTLWIGIAIMVLGKFLFG